MRQALLIVGIVSLVAGCGNSPHPINRLAPAPEFVHLTGLVRYPSGAIAPYAQLSAMGSASDTTSADSLGVYHLTLAFSGNSLLLSARSAPPAGGITVGVYYNLLEVIPDQDRVLDVELSHFQPI